MDVENSFASKQTKVISYEKVFVKFCLRLLDIFRKFGTQLGSNEEGLMVDT
jgi:hypothetical protein